MNEHFNVTRECREVFLRIVEIFLHLHPPFLFPNISLFLSPPPLFYLLLLTYINLLLCSTLRLVAKSTF